MAFNIYQRPEHFHMFQREMLPKLKPDVATEITVATLVYTGPRVNLGLQDVLPHLVDGPAPEFTKPALEIRTGRVLSVMGTGMSLQVLSGCPHVITVWTGMLRARVLVLRSNVSSELRFPLASELVALGTREELHVLLVNELVRLEIGRRLGGVATAWTLVPDHSGVLPRMVMEGAVSTGNFPANITASRREMKPFRVQTQEFLFASGIVTL